MNILLSDCMKQMKMISINGVAQVIMKIVVQDIGKIMDLTKWDIKKTGKRKRRKMWIMFFLNLILFYIIRRIIIYTHHNLLFEFTHDNSYSSKEYNNWNNLSHTNVCWYSHIIEKTNEGK